MAVYAGKATIPASGAGVKGSVDVTLSGVTSSWYGVVTPAEKGPDVNPQGDAADFRIVPGTGKITIVSENDQIEDATDVYYIVTDGSFLPGAGTVTATMLASTLDLSSKTVTLANGEVSAAELASTLDLSSKTVTLATGEISAGELADTLDLSGKSVTLATGEISAGELASTLDLSGKTVTLATGEISAGELADTLDLSGKTVTLAENAITKEVEEDSVLVIHDVSAASNGTALYTKLSMNDIIGTVMTLYSNVERPTVIETSEGRPLYIFPKPLDETAFAAVHNADPVTNLNASLVYFKVDSVDKLGIFGHLESVTHNNTATYFTMSNDVEVPVFDNDNAADGIQVYIDEDAVAGGSGKLLLKMPISDVNAYIKAVDGSYIKIQGESNPSAAGVVLYIDDDGANTKERIVFVSPTGSATYIYNNQIEILNDSDEMYIPVYIDEDATDGERFLIATNGGISIYAELYNENRLVKLAYSATASADGVQLYVVPNANPALPGTLQFVSPTTTNATNKVETRIRPFEVVKEE